MNTVSMVLEIDYRGYHGRRTKDIWEDQKAGRPKNLIRRMPDYMLAALIVE